MRNRTSFRGLIVKNRIILVLCFLLVLLIIKMDLLSAEIVQVYGLPEFYILDFILINSTQHGDILTRTFKLKVENKIQEPLYNVKFILIHTSDQATIDKGEVYLGTIKSGQTVISNDDFTYSLNLRKEKIISEIDIHWIVEYENIGGRKTGEVLAKEKL